MSAEEHPTYDLEAVYDEQISPLMSQIIAICKEHKLPMVAIFQYANQPDDAEVPGPHFCTTSLHWEGARLQGGAKAAVDAIYPRAPSPLVVTTRDGDGNVVNSTVIL